MKNPAQFKVVGGWVMLVLIGIVSMAWIQPGMLGHEKQELHALQQRLNRAEDGAAEIRNLVAQLSALKDSTISIKRVPIDSQFAALNQDLGIRLEALGIVDREITNGGSVELGPARSIPMRIRLTSGFTGVFETIQWIESLPRLIRVQRVQIKSTDLVNPWESQVEAEITLDAVFDPTGSPSALTAVDPEASR
jgi:Tfp pilus assembly protein PilO